MSHLFVNSFFERAFATRITIILALKVFSHTCQHERTISPGFKIINSRVFGDTSCYIHFYLRKRNSQNAECH